MGPSLSSLPMEPDPMSDFAVILPAAGRSRRFGDPKQKKVYAELDGRAVWLRAVEPFVNRDDVGQIILVIAPEDRELFERRFRPSVAFMNIRVIDGGAERTDSIARALELVDPSCGFVAVHDAARPCLVAEWIDAVFAAAREHGAALLAIPVADTIKRVGDDHCTVETLPRAGLYLAQTPQVFRRELLMRAYANRDRLGTTATDDAQLVEALGQGCAIVEGSPLNLKITTHTDLRLASAVLQVLPKAKREGPAHPFADEQAMWDTMPKIKPKDLF
jgi:2-C-methyl-D-erythritol 4-phosphate cytidylyltransferase